ncbi:MAG: efflux RND transporter periplasmic adaptor subunit [Dysgonamonadaceae bacterium]|nr:efflux RND transporter periplasmic adaptor subunit [Dysgonamonadaceae bacterium]
MKQTTIAVILALLASCGGKQATDDVPTAAVTRGVFYVDLYEEGEIEAVNSLTISSPNISWRYGNLKIAQMVKDGDEVNAGDTLIVFDPTEVQKAIVDAESRLEISYAELEKMKAQQESELEELKADYEVTRISQEISKIRFESAVYESEVKKKEIELNLEKAVIALDNARETIENREKIQKEDIKQKELSIGQYIARLEEARSTLRQLSIVTPSPGIVIISQNWSSGNKFQVGDQCWTGQPLIQLPDLTLLKAKVNINEVDIAKISKDLPVEIKPDAFSDSLFTGKVLTVANLAVNKERTSNVKVFPSEIILNESSKNLLPGLTVSCRIIIDKIENQLFVPVEGVHQEGDKFFVFKKKGGGFVKTEVETGLTNSDYVIVTSGLDDDDRIALADPFAAEKEAAVQSKSK